MMVPGSDRLGVTRGVNCSRLLAHRYVERYEDDVLAGGENLADWSRRGWRERAEKICYLSGRRETARLVHEAGLAREGSDGRARLSRYKRKNSK